MQSVWWPGLSTQLEQSVRDCPECIKYQTQRAEPLQQTPFTQSTLEESCHRLIRMEKVHLPLNRVLLLSLD